MAFPFDDLSLSWKVLTNHYNNKTQHLAAFIIENNSKDTLFNDWKLYWNQSPRTVFEVKNPSVQLRKINGDFYEMAPRADFQLAPGQKITVEYISSDWLIKESDGPVGVYFVDHEARSKQVKSFQILPFESEEQIARSTVEATPPYTALRQFEENEKLNFDDGEVTSSIIPIPKSYSVRSGAFNLTSATSITFSEGLNSEADILIKLVEEVNGLKLMNPEPTNAPGAVHLAIVRGLKSEQYSLVIDQNQITINGGDPAGVFYGIQSLIHLIPVESYEKSKEIAFPALAITDGPTLGYRGIHIDVSRHFFSKQTILKMIDILSRYKINNLLFYFTEDEGWRLEIKDLPELTEVGARRGHTLDDREYLQPSYGSGPDPAGPHNNGTGYYTRSDYIEILQYAQARHMKVIPQVNFPGHARAAIKAMEARYHKYKDTDPEKANEFRLVDPDDQSEYLSAQHYTDNIVCVCRESAFAFYEKVMDDIISIYEEAGAPLEIFHTGGDEVPRGAWTKSPLCEEFLQANPAIGEANQLQRYFSERATEIIKRKGLINGAWEEAAMNIQPDGWTPNRKLADGSMIAYIWNNIWGQQDLGYKMANAGFPVVLCNVTNLYFDLAYNNDPREPGLYWGGFCNARLAYEFIPGNLYKSTQQDALGNKFLPERDFVDLVPLSPQGQQNIIGIQAQLWAETLQDQDMLEYYYLPKLYGFAERAWNGDPVWARIENTAERNAVADLTWSRVAQVIGKKELQKLDFLGDGYNYRIPTPGIKISQDTLYMNTSYPGFEIRFTLDGSQPTPNSQLYTGPVQINGALVNAKIFNKQGRSGLTARSEDTIVD